MVDTATYAQTPLPLAFVATRMHWYGQLADNPVRVMGLAGPDDVLKGSGPNGSHVTVELVIGDPL